MARWLVALLSVACLGCTVNAGEALAVHRDIPYENISGVNPNLTSLDIYSVRPVPARPAPVVVWVHGGGWAIGDKSNGMRTKPALFGSAGYCLVSINYRLSPTKPSSDPKRVMYPIHERDVAAAVAWVHARIAEYGGDPERIALMGHSAGAHLVSIVSTDESFLKACGLPLGVIKGTLSLDTAGDDVAAVIEFHPNKMYTNAFGSDPAVWKQASPVTHVGPGKGIPPFFLVTRGMPARKEQCAKFTKALQQSGINATLVDATGYTHNEVSGKIGTPGETVLTPPIMQFLAECLGADPKAGASQTASPGR